MNQQKHPIKSIKIADPGYPNSLKSTASPPDLLYYIGTAPENSLNVAIVGSRKMSEYGRQALEKLLSQLQGQDICVVSGLAFGVDAYAHKMALQFGLKTMAILGSAINNIQPNINRPLAQKIIESGGAILSEYGPNQSTHPGAFPQRNRIIAGLCKTTIVVEAGAGSGALITAKFAKDYGRAVFAIPGSIFHDLSVGANQLLKEYAKPLTSAQDLLNFLGISAAKIKQIEHSAGLNEIELSLFKIIRQEPTSFEELSEKSKIPIKQINSVLSALEIKNKIRKIPGNYYVRNLSVH